MQTDKSMKEKTFVITDPERIFYRTFLFALPFISPIPSLYFHVTTDKGLQERHLPDI